MRPPGLQAPRCLSTTFCLLFHDNCRTSFSTSAPRWPRAAPGTSSRGARWRNVTRQAQARPEVDDGLASSRRTSPNAGPISFKGHAQKPSAELEHKALGHDRAMPKQAAASLSSPSLITSRRRSVPPGVKPHKQSLFISDLIRYGPDAAIATQATKAGHQQMAAAGRFFETGFTFLYSAEELRHHAKNDHIPEVVILGASNVGKSSFLNALVGKPGAARVSARPGKTILMNAYGVGPLPKLPRGVLKKGERPPQHSLVVVDTPGYGFRSQASWGGSILRYLQMRKTLRGAVVLLSSEKRLMDQDKWLLRSLAEHNTRTLVVLTKADKGGGSWTTTCGDLAQALRELLKAMERSVGNGWRQGSGWNPDVYITSAGMDRVPKLGNGGGMGGVRAAILEMAGFSTEDTEVRKKDETVTYGGPVVSFDDIKWKT